MIKMGSTQVKKKKISLLFVCLGNICRSPAAEGIMKKIVEKNDLQDVIEVDSAGTSGWHEGELPDERMHAHGEKRKYDFCSYARKFRKSDFDKFDYVIVMDKNNYNSVKALADSPEQIGKIHLMTEFSLQYGYYDEIPDPYYGNSSDFELVLDLLEDACVGLLQSIKNHYSLI
ncbi:MAG: low molecular weight phosphotyrosine protein phosphatase [Porphyromonadaceae bacterium]|nr:low molecular weight phosphotyrosine protein phosphatase [Porphyromonadaceae bacterium]